MAASAGVQQVLDAAGMTASDLQELEREGFQLNLVCKYPSFSVSPAPPATTALYTHAFLSSVRGCHTDFPGTPPIAAVSPPPQCIAWGLPYVCMRIKAFNLKTLCA